MTPNLRAKGHQWVGEDGRRRLWRFHSGLPIVTQSNCTEPFALSKTKDFELRIVKKNRLKTYPGLHQNGHANKVRNLLEHQLNNRTTSHSRLKRLFKLSSRFLFAPCFILLILIGIYVSFKLLTFFGGLIGFNSFRSGLSIVTESNHILRQNQDNWLTEMICAPNPWALSAHSKTADNWG